MTLIEEKPFNVEDVRDHIVEKGKLWSKGLREQDVDLLHSLYDEEACYLPDETSELHGKRLPIRAYWRASMRVIKDLQLEMDTLNGSRELLYETGQGTARIAGDEGTAQTVRYHYVNVWKLQKDGTYKVAIDTFNDIK